MSDTTFPPTSQATLQSIIKSYIYKQYEDDDDLQTFVQAQNFLAQKWLDDFNFLNLPVWSLLSGDLLDWVAWGLYGIRRPVLSYQKPGQSAPGVGPYATMAYGTLDYAGGRLQPANTNPISYINVTDDIFQRILTWHLYKGDGNQFNTRWLKRRIHRFLNGTNGYLTPEDNTYDVSITSSGIAITIVVTSAEIGVALQYGVSDGVLALPFQYTYDVQPTGVIIPMGLVSRSRAATSIRAKAGVAGQLSTQVRAVAGISGVAGFRPFTVPDPSGVLAATAGIRADFNIRRANGTTLWFTSGVLAAAPSINLVPSRILISMSGRLDASAG